jgi:hypothetical protein
MPRPCRARPQSAGSRVCGYRPARSPIRQASRRGKTLLGRAPRGRGRRRVARPSPITATSLHARRAGWSITRGKSTYSRCRSSKRRINERHAAAHLHRGPRSARGHARVLLQRHPALQRRDGLAMQIRAQRGGDRHARAHLRTRRDRAALLRAVPVAGLTRGAAVSAGAARSAGAVDPCRSRCRSACARRRECARGTARRGDRGG